MRETGRPSLRVTAGRVDLKTPVLVASGIGGYGNDLRPILDLEAIGGVVTKTIFRDPRPGNPPHRIAEVPAGMLNSIGLEGVGIESYLADKLPLLEGVDTRVVVSIGGYGPEDFAELAARLDQVPRCDGLEINISCPNVKEGGLDMGTHPHLAEAVIRAVRRATDKPVWAKLTPNVTRISDVGKACLDAGADALSAINTLLGMQIDTRSRRPVLSRGVGGLSGPAIRPVALAKCWELVRTLECDVIGIGGIACADDALQFLLAGCRAIQVGTVVYADPRIPALMAEELTDRLTEYGVTGLDAVIGSLQVNEDLALGAPAPRRETP